MRWIPVENAAARFSLRPFDASTKDAAGDWPLAHEFQTTLYSRFTDLRKLGKDYQSL